MKTMFFKHRLFSLLLLAFASIILPSCDREGETPTPETTFETALVGTWDISSYRLGGDEWMGLIATSAFITFQVPTDHAGIFVQEVTFSDGETWTLSGRYIVDEAQGQVTLYYEGEPIVADITITGGNKMHWESIQDEHPLVLKATKRT